MIQAELLTETSELHFRRMLSDPAYGMQEKHNGHRLVICKQDGALRLFNRVGEKSSKALPFTVKDALLRHPLTTFIIDGELVTHTATFHIFDALMLGDELLNDEAYEYREARYHAEFTGYRSLSPVMTARTLAAKERLWKLVKDIKGEGLVSKKMKASYRQGRADQHFKLKFTKECDVVVIGPSPEGKDSVEIGMYDDRGVLHRVSGCSLRGKFTPQRGQVVEVRFLYSTKEYHIVQPVLKRIRTDKRAVDCQLSQLKPYINKNWSAA